MRMSSALRSLMKRLFLSGGGEKVLVRLVSPVMTCSESCGTASRFRGDGDGDGDANAVGLCVLLSFFADKVRLAIPPHKSRKTKTNNTTGRLTSRYCIFTSETPYCVTLSAIAL